MNNDKLETVRHSASHVLMQALTRLYGAVPGVGPAIENGFYHDFDSVHQVANEDIEKIEKEMKKIVKENLQIKKKVMPIDDGIKFLKNKGYVHTAELAEELKTEGETEISFYEQEEFINMCKGPHINSTGELNPDAFKLTKLAGAYWKGDEKNKMLQRIYGVVFETKDELDKYLEMLKEAEKRDHRKLGKELDLFSFHQEAHGIPFFHPKGTIIYQELKNFWMEAQKEFNYNTILCPSMLDVSIWKKSGHWDHYKNDMYFIKTEDGECEFALRPMDCPGAILIYNNSLKSYKDLPLRFAEPGLITRNEKSGQLGGLMRVQQFTQDDAHIFITGGQIEEEVKKVIKLTDKIYKPFGLEYKAYLSTRPDDYMGDVRVWDIAEAELKKILQEVYGEGNYGLKEKDGAFYGPKIDYQLKDCIGRTWQCATIQLDFQMPLKFDCQYIDKDGKEKAPVLIHRTIMGSFERFMGILIEHFAGAFPLWLSPVQVKILPVSDKFIDYANNISAELKKKNIRVEVDNRSESLGKKIRESEMQKIPYMVIVGEKEQAANKVRPRHRKEGDIGELEILEFIKKLEKEIESKSLT